MKLLILKNNRLRGGYLVSLGFAFLLSVVLSVFAYAQHDHGHDEHGEEEHEEARGPNNGRLLVDGDIQVELAIHDAGVPPEFRAWITHDGKPVRFDEVDLNVELTRLGGQVDRFLFSPRDNYLLGDAIVAEPHAFDVKVTATVEGKTHQWEYESHEGRVTIAPSIAEKIGIVSLIAGEQTLHQRVRLFGKTVTDPELISHIRARYPGIVEHVNVSMGDQVGQGDQLLRVEANNSLQSYTITSPIAGTVIQRHANPGEVTAENELLTIANYRRLWVEFNVFPSQASEIKPDQPVHIVAGDRSAVTQIRYLTPTEHGGPSILARALLDNSNNMWTPDLMVEGAVTVDEFKVPLAVDNRALQTFRDWQVVFIQIGDTYEIRPLTLGRDDGQYTEVLDGLNVGDRYVVENSYLIKADLEKAGASHDH